MNFYKRIKHALKGYSSEAFVSDLRNAGATIGSGTYFFNPNRTYIDNVKPWLIAIGEKCSC